MPPRLRILLLALLVVVAGCAGTVDGPGTDADSTTTTAKTSTTTTGPTTTVDASEGTLEVHFINVEQSVATLVITPAGETMLIDTGHFTDDGAFVIDYLERLGITRIDHLVTTHNDADHIGGHAGIIEHFETQGDGVGAVYDPGIAASTQTYNEYLDAIEQYDVPLFEVREGDDLPIDGVSARVLGPPEPYLAGEERNENSVVLLLSFGEADFLFTGDAESEQEAYLVENYAALLDVEVLKAGHHGSRSSTSGDLLDVTTPEVVVISSAYDSQYGHPHEEVLQRLDARSVTTYWTATHGDIVFRTDGTAITVLTQYEATTVATALRSGAPATAGATAPLEVRQTIGGEAVEGTTTTTPASSDAGQLALVDINADAAGDDRENLNDEYLVFENVGDEPLEMTGWTVRDAAGNEYTLPSFTLVPGARVTIHTGSGTDDDDDLYWGSGSPVWNNDGDTITVETDTNETVLTEVYP